MQAPFIISVIAPTGVGKTHNVANLLQHFHDGSIPLAHRFNTKEEPQGTPYQLEECHYIGVRADDSYDITHNENVGRILAAGKKMGLAKTLKEMAADAHLKEEKTYGLLKMPKPASLIPDYIEKVRGKGKCLVIDDMSAFLDDFSSEAQTRLKTLFQAGSHHEGVSLIFIYQTVPKGVLGGTLFKSSHYIMFPVPQFSNDGLGVLVGDFRQIMHMVAGFSKTLLSDFEKLVNVPEKPNFVMYNKMSLITDKALTGETPPPVTSEDPDIKPESDKKKNKPKKV